MTTAGQSHRRPCPYGLALGIMLCGSQIFAQQDITGQTWTRWNEGQQVIYLAGFYAGLKADAAVFGQAERDHPARRTNESNTLIIERYKYDRQEYYADNIKYNFNTLRQLLDAFYRDPDNLLIAAPDAIRITMLRQDGQVERADFLLLTARRDRLRGR